MDIRIKNIWSKASIVVLLFVMVSVDLNVQFWKQEKKIIYWDIVSYYAYLPATFIYKDISLQFTKDPKSSIEHNYVFWPQENDEGELVIKTTMGLSYFYAPFFFLGHVAALISGQDTGGFSAPYKLALMIGALFWLLVGLVFLRKVLLKYFTDEITAAVLLIIGFGTNLFHYATLEPTMSHLYSFTAFSIFLWLVIRWEKQACLLNSLLLGLVAGLITLIRPTNFIIVFIFILYGVRDFQTLKTRIVYLLSKYKMILVMMLAGVLIILPQLIYWKVVTDDWFYYSYGSDESFFFGHPHIWDGLFSYRKGWFVYTPVMIFSLAGFFWLKDKLSGFLIPLSVFMVINLFLVFSWWSWWYGGSFGMRALIDSYALLALPLAAFLKWISGQKRVFRSFSYAIVFLFSFYGLFATVQYYYGAIHWDSMTKSAYWDSFGKIRPSGQFYELIKEPDYEAARKGEESY